MKKIAAIIGTMSLVVILGSSCERCHTCTYLGTDIDNDTTTGICSNSGKILTDQVRVLEKTNWECDD